MELLEEIYKNASMGADSISNLIKDLESKDNKIKKELENIKKDYEEFMKKAYKELKKCKKKPKDENVMLKAMSKMNIKKEVLNDNSDSAIADMVIQGISMGIIEMEKKIKCCEDGFAKKLAKEFIKFSEEKNEKLKQYL